MSIDPEVPYDNDLESIEEEENWRDLQIIAHHHAPQQMIIETSQGQLPDDSWLFPTDFTVEEVLGKGRSKLEEIRRDTSTSLKFNESMRQIDIWGEAESVRHARRLLDLIIERLQQQKDVSRPKSQRWGKPERELTKKEQRRADRKMAQQTEDRDYRTYPEISFQYKAFIPFPDQSVPSVRIFGVRDEFLNRIRAECKCYIRYNQKLNRVECTHRTEANVLKAAKRIRNWYLHSVRAPAIQVVHLIKQPSCNMVVKFRSLPSDFWSYCYAPAAQEQAMQSQGRLLEGLTTGTVVGQISENLDLINLNEVHRQDSELSDETKNLEESNAAEMKRVLEIGLESIRLAPWEIKMKLRFGHIVVTGYPRQNAPRCVDYYIEKILPNKNFEAQFAPSIGKSLDEIQDISDWLSSHSTEYIDSPRTSFVIEADQFPIFVDQSASSRRREEQRKPLDKSEQWMTTLIVTFTSEKRVGIWRCLTEALDVSTIRRFDLQDKFDCEIKLQRAIYLRKGEMRGTPHGLFVDGLALNHETDRLIFLPNSRCYDPTLITQKTKWMYAYQNSWCIELTRDEIWDVRLLNVARDRQELPIDLSNQMPHRTIFKLAMYREEWATCFAENLQLQLGEAPSWTPASFLKHTMNGTEAMEDMAEKAQTISKVLNKKCLL